MGKKFEDKMKKEKTLEPDTHKDLKRFGLRFLILLVATSSIYAGLYTLPFFRDIVGKSMLTAVASTSLVSLAVSSAVSIVKNIYRKNLSNKQLAKKCTQKYNKAFDLANVISLNNNKLDLRRLKLSALTDTADKYFETLIDRIAKVRNKEKQIQKKLDRHITSTKLSDKLDKKSEEKETLKTVLRENALKDKEISLMVGGPSKSMASTKEALKRKKLAPDYQKKLKKIYKLRNDEESLKFIAEMYMYKLEPLDYNEYASDDNIIYDEDISRTK